MLTNLKSKTSGMDDPESPPRESVGLTLFLAMVFVVPLTYEVVRILLEDRLDFDIVINRKLLRVMEVFIALMLFPSAAMYILCIIVYKLLVVIFIVSVWLVDLLSTFRILYDLIYWLACYVMFLFLAIGVITFIKYIT